MIPFHFLYISGREITNSGSLESPLFGNFIKIPQKSIEKSLENRFFACIQCVHITINHYVRHNIDIILSGAELICVY